LVARMATELGASALLPVLTERTNTARINTHRLTAIAIEAAEQCERLSVPGVAEPRRLAQVLSEWQPGRRLYAAVERLARDAGTVRMAADEASADALLIGPEGGFTPAELDVLSARPFVTLISLGSRILKAETAAAAGLACLQAARERWGRAPEGVAPH
jgi:16S rRNA (uracil1498-N3)-methyltransferase